MSWRLNILHHMSESYEALSELHAREERKKKKRDAGRRSESLLEPK